jgi:hypothetical protein
MSIMDTFQEDQNREATRLLKAMIQPSQYVGDVYSISYETASVQIHDRFRQDVGGIPSLCFLLATRISPSDDELDYQKEESSLILLRVMDSAPLPSDSMAERVRVELGQKVAGELEINWDHVKYMDGTTNYLLSFAGLHCRVLGTFFVDESPRLRRLVLRFGSDLSNYYPNKGLKVYKPNEQALETIVNYVSPDHANEILSGLRVPLGEVRYASTNRAFQGVSNVPVYLSPADLLGQKSALFGMTRTGKSNSEKIMLRSVFELRFDEVPHRIGQLIFDLNGEYANENVQDRNQQNVPSAIKNVWRIHPEGRQDDVVTYGIRPHPNDPNRKLMLLNFYREENLQIGKTIIDEALAQETGVQFVQSFRQVRFSRPDDEDAASTNGEVADAYRRALTRYNRHILAYRALLARAQFPPPANIRPQVSGLFNQDLLRALRQEENEEAIQDDDVDNNGNGDVGTGQRGRRRARTQRNRNPARNAANYRLAADILSSPNPSWDEVASALEYLHQFIEDGESGYAAFNEGYMRSGSRSPWADPTLMNILGMFRWPSGSRRIGRLRGLHTNQTTGDYAEAIYNDLVAGRLVIVDQSSGDDEINRSSAERIMRSIFEAQQTHFREGRTDIPEVLIYVEEAHNLLPAGSEQDLTNIWVRTAKEGAKYHIGLVYATQEVSSIQRNILKNTANWFIGHLNNRDETKELCKYYDFEDFEPSILRAQDRGFLRVKTLSNPFTVPVQVRKFEV